MLPAVAILRDERAISDGRVRLRESLHRDYRRVSLRRGYRRRGSHLRVSFHRGSRRRMSRVVSLRENCFLRVSCHG